MPAAGFAAEQGRLSFWGVVLAGVAGSVAGALPWYFIARWAGTERLQRWVNWYGKWLAISGSDVEKADRWFDRYGAWAVLLCRVVPGVRTLISVPAGFSEMPLGRFLLCTAAGTAVWSLLLAWIGWKLGENYATVGKYLSWIGGAVLILLVAWFIVWVYRRRRQKMERAD